jgi:hypothetical protein
VLLMSGPQCPESDPREDRIRTCPSPLDNPSCVVVMGRNKAQWGGISALEMLLLQDRREKDPSS